VTVLAARAGAAARASTVDPDGPARAAWSDPAARLRRPLRAGPGAWRRSALPG